jgi:hypothetical protein
MSNFEYQKGSDVGGLTGTAIYQHATLDRDKSGWPAASGHLHAATGKQCLS